MPFAMGADLSLLQYIQDHGVEYKDAGRIQDPLLLFKNYGVNFVRLRLFVEPDGRNGQVNTLPYTLRLARRVRDAGIRLLLDLHYSDGWADPAQQTTPAAWRSLSHADLTERVFTYTREVLSAFRREGCLPDMVQVGNEITNGMLWPDAGPFSDTASWTDAAAPCPAPDAGWDALADLLRAGIRAVGAEDPAGAVEVMLHIDKGGSRLVSQWFFDNLLRHGVTFDVIGLSFYPFWHGTLADLADNLAFLAQTYKKDIVVVETGYDACGAGPSPLPFPLTPFGQRDFLQALIRTVAAAPDSRGRGVFYWAPEWIAGSDWDGPVWSGAWENRALFDRAGNALPALRAFGLSEQLVHC